MKSFKTYTKENLLTERLISDDSFVNKAKTYMSIMRELDKIKDSAPIIYRGSSSIEQTPATLVTTKSRGPLNWFGRDLYKRQTGDKVGAIMRILDVKYPVFVSQQKALAENWGGLLGVVVPVGDFTGYTSPLVKDIVIDAAGADQFSSMREFDKSKVKLDGMHPRDIAATYKSKKNGIPKEKQSHESFLKIPSGKYFLINPKRLRVDGEWIEIKTYGDLKRAMKKYLDWIENNSIERVYFHSDMKIPPEVVYNRKTQLLDVNVVDRENGIIYFLPTFATSTKEANQKLLLFKSQLRKEGLIK